ncbi:hypothetical protein KSF81_05355 [Siccirubricoccus sp. G192]|nr:hypothetical protein [Siccirubricoccus sp. G192]
MGPQASKSYPGRRLVRPVGPRAERAKQEIDYGRRDVAGYVFGALQPATGAAFTVTYERRTTANWVDFLGQVEGWIGTAAERVCAVIDNLNIHGGTDVLLEFKWSSQHLCAPISATRQRLRPAFSIRVSCAAGC